MTRKYLNMDAVEIRFTRKIEKAKLTRIKALMMELESEPGYSVVNKPLIDNLDRFIEEHESLLDSHKRGEGV